MHSNHFAMHLVQIGVPIEQYLILYWHQFIQLAGWAGNDHWYGFGGGWWRELVCMEEGERLFKLGGVIVPLQIALFAWPILQ